MTLCPAEDIKWEQTSSSELWGNHDDSFPTPAGWIRKSQRKGTTCCFLWETLILTTFYEHILFGGENKGWQGLFDVVNTFLWKLHGLEILLQHPLHGRSSTIDGGQRERTRIKKRNPSPTWSRLIVSYKRKHRRPRNWALCYTTFWTTASEWCAPVLPPLWKHAVCTQKCARSRGRCSAGCLKFTIWNAHTFLIENRSPRATLFQDTGWLGMRVLSGRCTQTKLSEQNMPVQGKDSGI